jgi:hypothetical protein
MQRIFGDFVEEEYSRQECLIIHFSPTSVPLQQRWRNNGLSADFLSEYWTTFFPAYDISSRRKQREIKGAIGYIANELLENVMKFSYKPADHPVSLGLYLYQDEFKFYSHNAVAPDAIDSFQAYIQELLTRDTDEMYIQQLERNALDESSSGTRLGLLTMLNDYGARLAWKFETDPRDTMIITVSTMVQLAL